jgi:hypothetical protein
MWINTALAHIYGIRKGSMTFSITVSSPIMLSVMYFNCYAECHYAEYHYVKSLYAEHHYVECLYAEYHYVECLYAE